MSAHIEYRLLSKIISSGSLQDTLEEGIDEDKFGIIEARAMFSYLKSYFYDPKTRGVVPDLDIVEKRFPTVQLPSPGKMPIKALCKEMRLDWLRLQMENVMHMANEAKEVNPEKALGRLIQDARILMGSTGARNDLVLADSLETLRSEYIMIESSKGITGIPWPVGWGLHDESGRPLLNEHGRQKHPLNEETGGFRKGDFILLYGRPKSLKTWALIDIAAECYYHLNQRVLIYSLEMTPQNLLWRIVARLLGVNYKAFKQGKLSSEQREEFMFLADVIKAEEGRRLHRGQNRSLMFTCGHQGSLGQSMQSLQAKIEEFSPDIVLADSVYMFQPERVMDAGWKDMKAIAYGLKNLAQSCEVPIVATSQANRRGEELRGSSMAEIAYGDSFAQSCDLALRIIKSEDELGRLFLSFIVAGSRETSLSGFRLEVQLAEMFKLDRMFDSPRQIQAILRAEEDAINREYAKAITEQQKEAMRNLRTGDKNKIGEDVRQREHTSEDVQEAET